MKISKLFASLFLLFFIMSCADDQTDIITEEEGISESLTFSDIEKLEQKELLYRSMRDQIDIDLSTDFVSRTNFNNLEKKSDEPVDIESFVSELKKFHSERLSKIYSMRKSINFISIQSIVDEINSLKLISPEDSEDLFNKYSASLINRHGIVSIAQNIAHPNITNGIGTLKFNNKNINLIETGDDRDDFIDDRDDFIYDDPIPIDPVITDGYIYDAPDISRTHISAYARRIYNSVEYIVKWSAGVNTTDYVLWKRSTPFTSYQFYVKVNGVTVPSPGNFYAYNSSTCLFFNFGASNGGVKTLRFPRGSQRTSVSNYGNTLTGKMELFGSVDPSAACAINSLDPNFNVSFLVDVDRIYFD